VKKGVGVRTPQISQAKKKTSFTILLYFVCVLLLTTMQALQIITRSLGRKGKLLASRQQKKYVLVSESDK
jgi:hypothetical protein